MEKKTNKPILTLSLPFIQLDNERVYDSTSYDESGVFFVKDVSGVCHIAEVNLEERAVYGTCVNANICNILTEQLVTDRMEDMLNPIRYRLEELNSAICNATGDVVRKLDELLAPQRESVEGVYIICSKVEHLENALSSIESAVRCAVEKKPSDIESLKGYVSEESVVEIIKNVRK